ncbi:MAG: glycosyltransferase family 87 protein [Kiritimatiellia bacterium]|nr:DUF2029 domain-containing protein [Lentisphaerota bacterium]
MKLTRIVPIWPVVVAGWLAAWLPLWLWGNGRWWPPVLPDMPVGVDLRLMLGYSRDWLQTGNPFVGLNPYPPLAAVLFAPLTALPFIWAYVAFTALTLAAFLSVTLWLPLRIFPRADRWAIAWVAVSGLFSYGLCFELSWGQFNVLAMACAAWGLYAFHRARGWRGRWAAYVLLCVAIQLKVYPAIFVLLMTRHPRAWRQNLFRWCGLGAANLLLLFALGPRVFMDFLQALHAQAAAPYVWAGNHSLQSWAAWAGHPWLAAAGGGLLAVCLLVGAGQLWRRPREALPWARVALLCALATMLAPGVSHDYKLATLPMAFAFYIAAQPPLRARSALLLGLVCFLEAWTLFSATIKPAPLQNAAPALLALAVIITLGSGKQAGYSVLSGQCGELYSS